MEENKFSLVPVDYAKPYREQTDCKRHVVGAYANLARHNMTVTINAIFLAIGMETIDENNIENAFNKTQQNKIAELDNLQKIRLQKRLYRHFPFFKRMNLEDSKKKTVQLKSLLEVMNDFTRCMAMLRNCYTHYCPYSSEGKKKDEQKLKIEMGKKLQVLYDKTGQTLRSNESIDYESNEVFATLRVREDVEKIYKKGDKGYKEVYDFYKDPAISKKQKRGISFDPRTKIIKVKTVKYIYNPDYPVSMTNDTGEMSDAAIIYFICLFLEKKDAFKFMDEVGFTKQIKFEGADAAQQLLYVKEIMCMNRIRMTKTKVDSQMSETALGLDMLNELRKCPKPLFKVLGKEAREEFKDDATVIWEKEHGKDAVSAEEDSDDNEEPEASKNTPRSTFVRWEDRFPVMALRFIDYKGIFKNIRFQIDLGKYRFAFYNHDKTTSVDNADRLRILQKELHGFGRIEELEEKRKEKWKDLFEKQYIENGLTKKQPDKPGQDPYVTNQHAMYAIDEKSHSIGLRWEGWENTGNSNGHYKDLDKAGMFLPYLPAKPSKPENGKRQEYQGEQLLPPQAVLNLYELPALLFYQYLLKKFNVDKTDTETLIKESYNNLKKLFEDIAGGTLLPTDKVNPIAEAQWNKYTEEQRTNRRNILASDLLSKGYHVKIADIPDKIEKYLLGISVDNTARMRRSAVTRLEERLKKKQKELDNFIEKKNRIGTKQNKFDRLRAVIKTGTLGQQLIKDIMDWQTTASKENMKLTGQNYMAIQAALSLFGQTLDDNVKGTSLTDLENIFIKAKILPAKNIKFDKRLYHPFLQEVLNKKPDCVETLYESYLKTEINHINDMLSKVNTLKKEELGQYIPFLKPERIQWKKARKSDIIKLAGRYLEKPIRLANGIFTEKIFELLKGIENDGLIKDLEKAAGQNDSTSGKALSDNAAYLIGLYFEHCERDHPQPFYNTIPIDGTDSPYRHTYRIFKKLYGKKIEGTNKTEAPMYTIQELRELRKKALTAIKEHVENYVIQPWVQNKQKRFEAKIKNKLNKKKIFDKKIIRKEIAKAVAAKIKELRDEETSKLQHQLKKVYENERDIRRYKTQDILMFMMARDILKAKSNDEKEFMKGFCLKFVMSDSLLDKKVDFEWGVNLVDDKGNSKSKKIVQKDMKIKDYGQFYKFASDHERLRTLLTQLSENVFQRAEIENEFSYYDANRSEVFRQVYILESEAYQLKPELLDDSNDNKDWFFFIDEKTGKNKAIRDSFIKLLEILIAGNDGILDNDEKELLRTTRNSFGHNTYEADLNVVFKGKEKKKAVPEVANGMKDNVVISTCEIEKKLQDEESV